MHFRSASKNASECGFMITLTIGRYLLCLLLFIVNVTLPPSFGWTLFLLVCTCTKETNCMVEVHSLNLAVLTEEIMQFCLEPSSVLQGQASG